MTEGREGRETREDEKSTPKIERERPHVEQREPPWLADPQLPQVHSRGKESEEGEGEARGRSEEGVMLAEESERSGGGGVPEEGEETNRKGPGQFISARPGSQGNYKLSTKKHKKLNPYINCRSPCRYYEKCM